MGKKLFRTFLTVLLIFSQLQIPAWAETAVVTGSDVNMREGPGTNFRIVDCLPEGETVIVTDRSNGNWVRVEHDGVVGFMSAAFLEIDEAESTQPAESVTQELINGGQPGYVDAMYVRFRSAPGSEYSVLGEYNRGKPLLYYGTFGDWAACIIDGQPGFLYADFIALGYFSGWGIGTEDGTEEEPAEEEQSYELPLNLLIMETPQPSEEPEYPTDSEQLAMEHAEMPGVQQIPGYINANYVLFRKGPATSYPIIEIYQAGTPVGITGIYRDWTACLIDGEFGFVFSEYITVPSLQTQEEEETWTEAETTTVSDIPIPTPLTVTASTDGYVAGNNVRMRGAPSMSAQIVAELSYGNALTIVGVSGDWTAVICNGQAGYIYSQFVRQGNFALIGESAEQTETSSLGGSSYEKGVQIAQYAMQFVGCPYSWGGKDPSGFDCSGLVYYVYQHFGITLERVAQDQAGNGVHVDPDQLQPGDVLCFYSGSSYIGHSGIYLGYGMFVHAQNSATGVVVTELAGHYSERGFEARRMV